MQKKTRAVILLFQTDNAFHSFLTQYCHSWELILKKNVFKKKYYVAYQIIINYIIYIICKMEKKKKKNPQK